MRIDLYSPRHKELRKELFDASVLAGSCDVNVPLQLIMLDKTIKELIKDLVEHGHSENTYLHPIVAKKCPDVRASLEDEHEYQDQVLAMLLTQINDLQDPKLENPKRAALGLEFYRALNRFIAEYLLHLDKEEYAMQNFWELCCPEDTFAVMIAFKAVEEPENFASIHQMALKALNETQLKTMFETIKENLGSEIFQTVDEACQKAIAASKTNR